MNREEILNKLKGIITDITDIDSSCITESCSLIDDLSISSLEVMAIISETEDSFHISIPEKDLRDFITVGDLVNYLERIK